MHYITNYALTPSLPGRSACRDPGMDPGLTIVNPTAISVMYGYLTWQMTTEISVMYGIEGVKHFRTYWAYVCHDRDYTVPN